jgi:hypothetical protein
MIRVSEQSQGQPLAAPQTGLPTKAAQLLVMAVNALVKRTGGVSGEAFGPLPSYTVATLPSASVNARCWIWVSNETGGATAAISDGTNWRRMTDRAIVS